MYLSINLILLPRFFHHLLCIFSSFVLLREGTVDLLFTSPNNFAFSLWPLLSPQCTQPADREAALITQCPAGKATFPELDDDANKWTTENTVCGESSEASKRSSKLYFLKQNHALSLLRKLEKLFFSFFIPPPQTKSCLVASENIKIYLELPAFVSVSHSNHSYRALELQNNQPLIL